MKRSKLLLMWLAGMLILLVSSCRSDDEELVLSSVTNVTPGVQVTGPVKGFFLLNEWTISITLRVITVRTFIRN